MLQDSKLEWKKSPEGHRKISLNLGSFDLKEISLNQAQQLVLSTASTNINALLEENNVTKTQVDTERNDSKIHNLLNNIFQS